MVADTRVATCRLSHANLNGIMQNQPGIALKLLHTIGGGLARRLKETSDEVSALGE